MTEDSCPRVSSAESDPSKTKQRCDALIFFVGDDLDLISGAFFLFSLHWIMLDTCFAISWNRCRI